MRTWARATRDQRCGCCSAIIRQGDPIFLIAVVTLTAPKVRCRLLECAGEPAPADLPPLIERLPIELPRMVRVTAGVASLPFDYKQRQAEREPGCDDE